MRERTERDQREAAERAAAEAKVEAENARLKREAEEDKTREAEEEAETARTGEAAEQAAASTGSASRCEGSLGGDLRGQPEETTGRDAGLPGLVLTEVPKALVPGWQEGGHHHGTEESPEEEAGEAIV